MVGDEQALRNVSAWEVVFLAGLAVVRAANEILPYKIPDAYLTELSSAWEKVAKASQRFSGRAADAVVDVSAATADVVEDTGTSEAEVIEDAGDGAASATRKTTGSGKAAGRTTGPKRTTGHPSSE